MLRNILQVIPAQASRPCNGPRRREAISGKNGMIRAAAALCVFFFATEVRCQTDLNRLELGIHDLAEMKTVSGITLVFDPTKITMAYALPRPAGSPAGGRAAVTNIIGLAGGPQEVDESVDNLLERLNLKPYFIPLTLADGVSVSVKVSAISFFRAIEPWDHTRAEAKSAVSAGGRPIFVRENVSAIKDAINAIRRKNRSEP